MGDKRRCHRLKMELPASFVSSREKKNVSIGTTLDISAVGISLTSREELKKGQEIEVYVVLPTKEKIMLHTKVIWVTFKYIFDVREYTVGLKILESMHGGEKRFVQFYADQVLKFFKDGVPGEIRKIDGY